MSSNLADNKIKGTFYKAHDFFIQQPKFINVKGNYIVNWNDDGPGTGIVSLRKMASVGASQDAAERCPPPRCAQETRVEVLRQINHWIDNPMPNCPVLWLYGPAGAGKSAIAQTITERAETNGYLGASFFFARKSPTRNSASYLFPTIAYQLALRFSSYKDKVDEVMRKNPDLADKSIEVQFKKLLVDIWDVCSLPEGPSRIISIDGIDECQGEKSQEYLLTLIGQAISRKILPIRFIFFSRPEPHLVATFSNSLFGSISRRVVLDDSFNPTDDIVRYLYDGFRDIWKKGCKAATIHVEQPWPTDAVVRDLALRSSGQFIYARTVLKFVGAEFTHPVSQLAMIQGPNVSNSSAFSDLDGLYLQILSTHPRPVELIRILAYILTVKYPSPLILDNLLNKPLGTVMSILSGLHSLLEIPNADSPWSIIEPYHASFLDFIEDPNRSGDFYVDKFSYYAEVVESCIVSLIRWFYPSSSLITRCDPARLATTTQGPARLLYGLNALIKEDYQIDCRIDAKGFTYFVVVLYQNLPNLCPAEPPILAWKLRTSVTIPCSIEDVLQSGLNHTSLIFLSQLLQLDLDDPKISLSHWNDNFKCLQILAMRGILPPSLFVNKLEVSCDNIDRVPVSGGAYVDVYKGQLFQRSVYIKVLRTFSRPKEHHTEIYKKFINEVLLWRQLSHRNILPYLGANIKLFFPRLSLISPWMSKGNIVNYLAKNPAHDILTSICEVVEGIRYLHTFDPPICHKDIRGINIIVDDMNCCCLTGFGTSSIMELQSRDSGNITEDSMYWMPPEAITPEVFQGQDVGLPGDIYSLGCTIYELYTRNPPFSAFSNVASVCLAVAEGNRPPLPPPFVSWTVKEERVWKVVEQCWKHQPDDRPSIDSVREQIMVIQLSET